MIFQIFFSFWSWKNFNSKAGKSAPEIFVNAKVFNKLFTIFGAEGLELYKITRKSIFDIFSSYFLSSKTYFHLLTYSSKWYQWNNFNSLTKVLNPPFSTFHQYLAYPKSFIFLPYFSLHLKCKRYNKSNS